VRKSGAKLSRMIAKKSGKVRGAEKTIKSILTPEHVAAFADWIEETSGVSTVQVIRRIGKEEGHAAAVKLVRLVCHQLSTTIVAEGEA